MTSGRASLVEAVRALGTGLDILVNNAGTNVRRPATAYGDEDIAQVMDTNLASAFGLARAFHPELKARGGCVVNVSSVAGLVHVASGAPYGMSKAAMVQMTRNLACEWAADGIRVNAVAPWYIAMPLADLHGAPNLTRLDQLTSLVVRRDEDVGLANDQFDVVLM